MDASSPGLRIPIISLYRKLIVSIQVSLTDALVEQLKEDISHAIAKKIPKGLALDVSGTDVLDSYLTCAIRDIALISQLMGVRTVICGLSPSMAITLVEMGLDLANLETELDLEAAFERLERPADEPLLAAGLGHALLER